MVKASDIRLGPPNNYIITGIFHISCPYGKRNSAEF